MKRKMYSVSSPSVLTPTQPAADSLTLVSVHGSSVASQLTMRVNVKMMSTVGSTMREESVLHPAGYLLLLSTEDTAELDL